MHDSGSRRFRRCRQLELWAIRRRSSQSVKEQTYQNLECIIVDNGSDDDSADVIADSIRGLPQFKFHKLSRNFGQLGGAMLGLRHVTHDYVTFLDSDDVLFPNFLETHIQVHIGAEFPTGFTSSTCLDINAGGAVLTGSNWWMLRSWKEGTPSMRAVDRTVRLEMVSPEAYSDLAERTRYLPFHRPGWNWCVGSSNVYRRVLIDRLRPKLSTDTIFGGVDGFFTPILHAVTGTNVIDKLLNAYRVHGTNDYSMLPGLVGVRSSYGPAEARAYNTAKLTILSLLDGIEALLQTAPANRYWQILDTVASTSRGQAMFSEKEIKDAFGRQYLRLIALFGEGTVIRELLHRMKRRDCQDIIFAAVRGRKAFSSAGRFAAIGMGREIHRLRRVK